MKSKTRFLSKALTLPIALALSGCISPQLHVRPLDRTEEGTARSSARSGLDRSEQRQTRVEMLRSGSAAGAASAGAGPSGPRPAPGLSLEQIEALVGDEGIDVTLPAQPLPQFIDTVFGQVLEVPYALGPGIAQRQDQVALRGSVRVSKRAFFAMVQTALRDYGIALSVDHGIVRVFQDEVLAAGSPLLVRQRELPDDVAGSRSIIQFFELQSIDVNSLVSLLQDTYPDVSRLRLTPRQDINTLVISGNAREVAAAAEIINQIDQPRFAGAQVARVEPTYWSAQQLASSVVNTLTTEGYQAAVGNSSIQRAVTFLPVSGTNQLLLFSNLPEAFNRALYWLEQLDQASALGDQEGVFVYQVENTEAEHLGQLIGMVSTGGVTRANTQASSNGNNATSGAANGSNAASGGAGANAVAAGRITIDVAGNRLLFRGTPSEFARARDLMEQLDTPPRQVLIEMTIAEVTLTDETRFGVEWELAEIVNGNDRWTGGTQGGLGLGTTGLVLEYAHPDVRAALNAYATNNNVNILSTPRLVARSGGEAEIQVGTDVPIITSQQAAQTQTSGGTDILQTVQYRRTGVILNVRPVVLGDGRVDIEIQQEVSSAQSNNTAEIASPLILNRNIRTQISLREGATAVIGGLIQDAYGRGNQGVPVLKDLPFVGQAFRTDTVSADRTELLVLITPHIVGDEELNHAADNLSRQLNRGLARRGPHAYTLLPWTTPLRPSRTHGGQDIFSQPRARRWFGVGGDGERARSEGASEAQSPAPAIASSAGADAAPRGNDAAAAAAPSGRASEVGTGPQSAEGRGANTPEEATPTLAPATTTAPSPEGAASSLSAAASPNSAAPAGAAPVGNPPMNLFPQNVEAH